jgi:hypothetical protein
METPLLSMMAPKRRAHDGVVGGVERPVRVEACDVLARLAVDRHEGAADDESPIRQEDD